MIKINLLPATKKKKRKPIPTFLVSAIVITVIVVVIQAYFIYFFNSRVSARKAEVSKNEKELKELKEKIKAVEDYERRNTVFQERKKIIEQLGKNKTVPVKILDEVSYLLPAGVWLQSMDVKGTNVNLSCTAFTNTDVVNYVNNLKKSRIFTDVYLQESVQSKQSGLYLLYNFKLRLKVKT